MLLALFLVGVTLRPLLIAFGPLASRVAHDTGASYAAVGLATSLPVLLMGLCTIPTALIRARLGERIGIAAALVVAAAFGAVRLLAPTTAEFLLLTVPMGIGIGVAGALLPLAVRLAAEQTPAGVGTGAYAVGIQVGATGAAVASVPLAVFLGDWRGPLLLYAAAIVPVIWLWLRLTRPLGGHRRPVSGGFALGVWPLALIAFFGGQSALYYGTNAWLPAALMESGWSETASGLLIGIANALAIFGTIVAATQLDRIVRPRLLLVVPPLCMAGAFLGVLLVPSLALLWCSTIGLTIGLLFPSLLVLPLKLYRSSRQAAAAALLMLGFGYALAAASTVLLGASRDLLGGFDVALVSLAAIALAITVVGVRMTAHFGLQR